MKVVILQHEKTTEDMEIEELLMQHDIRPTAVRLLVGKAVLHKSETFSLIDVENWMPEMDRSSIFRALKLFAEHQLLHEIDDGSGQCKYCVCRCEHNHHLNHIHFACMKCGKTYCIEDTSIPKVELPEGFLANDYEYVVKGVCAKCSGKML